MYSAHGNQSSFWLGSPIRTSPDHRLLASPRGFSQLATSFFAYLRQGIHTHALSSLTIKLTPKPQSLVLFVHVFASAPLPAVFTALKLCTGRLELVALRSAFTFVPLKGTPFLTAQCPSDIQLSKINESIQLSAISSQLPLPS